MMPNILYSCFQKSTSQKKKDEGSNQSIKLEPQNKILKDAERRTVQWSIVSRETLYCAAASPWISKNLDAYCDGMTQRKSINTPRPV